MTPPVIFIGMETSGALRRRFQSMGFFAISADVLPAEDGSQYPESARFGPAWGVPNGGHIQDDVFKVLNYLSRKDLWPTAAVLHPTCTLHTLSAQWAFPDPDFIRYPGVGYHQRVKPGTLTGAARREAREEAERDLEKIRLLPIKIKVVENPRGTIPTRTRYGRATDVLQPYEFGDDASKATCLWAFDENGDPIPLEIPRDPAQYVQPRMICSACGGRNNYDAAFTCGCVHCGAEPGKLLPRWSNQTDKNQNRLTPSDDRWKDRSRTFPGIADAIAAAVALRAVGVT